MSFGNQFAALRLLEAGADKAACDLIRDSDKTRHSDVAEAVRYAHLFCFLENSWKFTGACFALLRLHAEKNSSCPDKMRRSDVTEAVRMLLLYLLRCFVNFCWKIRARFPAVFTGTYSFRSIPTYREARRQERVYRKFMEISERAFAATAITSRGGGKALKFHGTFPAPFGNYRHLPA